MSIEFPERLRPYRELIESTAQPTVLFRRVYGPTRPRQSKLGGAPYFPASAKPDVLRGRWTGISKSPWPKHPKTGKELQLLLQVDFAKMPKLPLFPTSGILQIFVDDEDWHDLDRHIRAVYHPNTSEDPYDFGDVDITHFRVTESALDFHLDHEFITRADFRFNDVYAAPHFGGQSFAQLDEATGFALHRAYLQVTVHRYKWTDEFGRGRNKLGGYHYSQNAQDPRASQELWRDSVLLAQFQDYDELSWGDGGSAQFFIKTASLTRRNFSDLMFHWDST